MMVRRRVNLYCAQYRIKHQGYRRPGKIDCLGLNTGVVFSIENNYSLDLIKWCLINILDMMISNAGFPFPEGSQREQVFCQTLEMLNLSHISYYLQFFPLETKSLGRHYGVLSKLARMMFSPNFVDPASPRTS